MSKKKTYTAVHLFDTPRTVEGENASYVVAVLAIDSPQDDGRPVEVEMTAAQARRWAASLMAMAAKAETLAI